MYLHKLSYPARSGLQRGPSWGTLEAAGGYAEPPEYFQNAEPPWCWPAQQCHCSDDRMRPHWCTKRVSGGPWPWVQGCRGCLRSCPTVVVEAEGVTLASAHCSCLQEKIVYLCNHMLIKLQSFIHRERHTSVKEKVHCMHFYSVHYYSFFYHVYCRK